MRSAAGISMLTLLLFRWSAVPAAGQANDSAAAATEPDAAAAATPYDWLIHGGALIDGTGTPARAADLLLRGGLIAHVGTVDPDTVDATNRFDATGLVVTPGFIDAHAHGGPGNGFINALAQGVTTVILGQDGSSPGAREMAARMDAAETAGPAVNVAYLVGHNTIRSESGVGFSDPGPDDLDRMAELVDRAMDAGALGLSTGLEYTPGNRADADELAAIARPVAERGGVVTSHLRSEDADQVESAVAELLEQGAQSGAAVHVSHIKVVLGDDPLMAERILDMLAAARAEGRSATADVYPYLASFTGISILFPEWARGPTPYAEVVRDRRDELAEYLRNRVVARNGPEATLFGSGSLGPGARGERRLAGRTLAEVAEDEERPFEQILVDLGPSGARAAYFVMDEDVMLRFLADPWVAVSSDGSPTMAHPRGYGSFARVLDRYSAQEVMGGGGVEHQPGSEPEPGSEPGPRPESSVLFSLEEAVRKMTSLPASIFDLDDAARFGVPTGRIATGWAADLAVFDPAAIRDRATFEEPHRTAVGMSRVWVNGGLAWSDGAPTAGDDPGSEALGRVLQRR